MQVGFNTITGLKNAFKQRSPMNIAFKTIKLFQMQQYLHKNVGMLLIGLQSTETRNLLYKE